MKKKNSTPHAASLAFAIVASFPLTSMATEPCLAAAAGDYGIPIRILEAMRVAGAADRPANPKIAAREFGPMGLGEPVIQAGANALGMSTELVQTEACANYRVSAWFLDQARQKAGGDIFGGPAGV